MNMTLNESDAQLMQAVIPERSPFGRRDKAMLTFFSHTGLRVGEITGLDQGDVADFRRQAVRKQVVLPAKVCKGHRSRTVPLNRTAQAAIAQLLAFNRERGFPMGPDQPLLFSRSHQRLPIRAVQRLVQDYREKAGLVGVTPHKFRHLFGDRLVRANVNNRYIQTLLGHRQLATVEIYTRSQPEALAAAVDLLG